MKAFITGITGMDGSYLADLLLSKNYEVCGLVRRVSTPNTRNINHIINDIEIFDGDVTDLSSLIKILGKTQPDEIYNLAAQSFVGVSWDQPILTSTVTGLGALNVFEAARKASPHSRIYQASSSEMYSGNIYPQNETTPFKPRSPYGTAKLFAHETARVYRESHDMFVSCGILFNHEGPRRGIEFVTQKIVDAAVRQVYKNEKIVLELGNVNARRDWSHAKDMVNGMWLMLQQDEPGDYVLASGEAHSVKMFVEKTYLNLHTWIEWVGEDEDMIARDENSGQVLVKINKKFYRPNEIHLLMGDASKARKELGWVPEYSFKGLISDMVENYRG